MATLQLYGSASEKDIALQVRLLAETDRVEAYFATRIPSHVRRYISGEDLVQEVWMAAIKSYDQLYEDGPDAFPNWLLSIAQRKLHSAIRVAETLKRGGAPASADRVICTSRLSAVMSGLVSAGHTPSGEASIREAAAVIESAINEMPVDRRDALKMHFIEGRSSEEIAMKMNKSDAAIRGLLFRAVKQLRDQVARAFGLRTDDGPDSPQSFSHRPKQPGNHAA